MERSGVTPDVAVAAADLARLFEAPGPFATIYLATDPAIDNAAWRSEQRWKTARAELEEAGAPEPLLAAVDPLVPEAHLHGHCLAAVGNGDGLLHVEHPGQAPPRDRVRWAPLPTITPLVAWRQWAPPYVIVAADRRGADLTVVRHDAPDVRREAGGGDDPLSRSSPGGWSQRRYQQRAENQWEHNAADVGAELSRLVERWRPRLLVAAGDVRALQLLRQALPSSVLDIFQTVDGGRSTDGSEGELEAEAARRVASAVAADTAAILEKFREERGQGDRAVEGAEATMRALAMAQVDVLLVHDDPDDQREAWFGPDATHVAPSAADLRAVGVQAPVQARLVDVLVRAALGTGAGVRVLPAPEALAEGVGAVLRWTAG